jgi:hypothetical protein
MADKKISALTGATTPLAGTEVLPIVQSGATVKVAASDITAGRAVSALSYAITGTSYSAPIGTNTTIGQTASIPHQAGNAGSVSLLIEDGGNPCGVFVTNTFDGTFSSQEVEIKTCEGGISAATTRLKATKTGDIQVSTGNLVIGTSGKGIDFSATPGTGTSELLDDYEEGTWTPNLTFGGGNTGMAGTFTGNYTKVGNQVTVDIRIALTAKGSSTGIAVIGVLPFSAKAYPCAVIDASSGVVGPATTWLGAVSGTDMYLFYQDVTTRTLYSQANFTDTADLRLGLTYLV